MDEAPKIAEDYALLLKKYHIVFGALCKINLKSSAFSEIGQIASKALQEAIDAEDSSEIDF